MHTTFSNLLYIFSTLSILLAAVTFITVKKNKFDTATFLLIAFSAIGFLIASYVRASDIASEFGTVESFGQFGDYIGGILNPIFGFTTVFLLLKTYSLQHNEAERDRKIKSGSELRSMLESALANFKTLVTSNDFEESGSEGNRFSLAIACMNKQCERYKELSTINKFITKTDSVDKFEMIVFIDDNNISSGNFSAYRNIYNEMLFIIDLFQEALSNEVIELRKTHLLRRYDVFLIGSTVQLGLINYDRYHELLDLALTSNNLIEDKFRRTLHKPSVTK